MSAAAANVLPVFDAPQQGHLSADMLNAFDKAGVILLRDFCTPAACARLRERANALVDAFDPATVKAVFSSTKQTHQSDEYFIESGGKIRFFLEEESFDDNGELRQAKRQSLNKMGHAMHDLDPVFDAFSRTPELRHVVSGLGFDEPGIIQSMYIFKPPRIGGEVICHQDSTYIYTEPESCIGFWFALEEATLENGCMQFIPGSHKQGLKARNYRQAGGALITEVLDDSPWPRECCVPAEAPVGTLAIFHGRTAHMSEPNRSSKSRHAYTLHVIDQACHYPAENWLQRGADMPLRGFD